MPSLWPSPHEERGKMGRHHIPRVETRGYKYFIPLGLKKPPSINSVGSKMAGRVKSYEDKAE
jgi:hypothetical protein